MVIREYYWNETFSIMNFYSKMHCMSIAETELFESYGRFFPKKSALWKYRWNEDVWIIAVAFLKKLHYGSIEKFYSPQKKHGTAGSQSCSNWMFTTCQETPARVLSPKKNIRVWNNPNHCLPTKQKVSWKD